MSAIGLLDKIEVLIPRLRGLAEAGELEGDYWFDLATCNELMAGVVEAFDGPDELPGDDEPAS